MISYFDTADSRGYEFVADIAAMPVYHELGHYAAPITRQANRELYLRHRLLPRLFQLTATTGA